MKYVAKALVYDSTGQLLALTRGDSHPLYPLHLDLPGGVVEPRESNIDGMVRELQEEIGIELSSSELSLVSSQLHNKNMTYLLYKTSLGQANPPIQLSWEHSSYSWTAVEKVINGTYDDTTDSYFMFVLRYLKKK